MVFQIIKENGQKKIVPLTADVGAGNPVGSYLYLEKKSNPQGYLYCDGSTFDETKYPLLYAYLGSNVLPDWRELGAKGAEKNTTLIFDSTETDPSTGQAGTQNHDVFAQGEFKDDQLQDHKHKLYIRNGSGTPGGDPNVYNGSPTAGISGSNTGTALNPSSSQTVRKGEVTRGKSRAVFIYIKATSGLSENAQDNVINTLNEERSYSTTEHLTGRKWIDGKPTYEKTIDCGNLPNNTIKSLQNVFADVDTFIKLRGFAMSNNTNIPLPYIDISGGVTYLANVYLAGKTNLNINTNYNFSSYKGTVTVEYTKTTD